ncbi:MAG: nuclear transport factor 2 family protein [Sphingobium sp.]
MEYRDLQALADRAAIQDVLLRYFHAADRGDREAMRGCFTQDVRAHYDGRAAVEGVDALIEQIGLFRNLESGACRIATHFAGNLVFRALANGHAETETNAFAFLLDASGETVAVRSLRYLDRLRREQGQWRIAARIHTLDWSGEMPCTFARAFAAKVNGFPAEWPLP